MTPAEMLAVFPEPQVYEDWMGGNLNDALLFHGLRFHFDKCDGVGPLPASRLNCIVVHQRENAMLFDRPMADWTWSEVMQELRRRGYLSVPPVFEDCQVPYRMGMDFDDSGWLAWMQISAAPGAALDKPCE
jgi:hypothetical protein